MESKVEKKMTSKLSEWGPEGLGGFITKLFVIWWNPCMN